MKKKFKKMIKVLTGMISWVKSLILAEEEYNREKPRLFDDDFYALAGAVEVSEEAESFADLVDEAYSS